MNNSQSAEEIGGKVQFRDVASLMLCCCCGSDSS